MSNGGSELDRARIAALRDLARRLDDEVSQEVLDGGGTTTRLRLLGEGIEAILAGIETLEPLAKRSVWNLQPQFYFDPEDPGLELNDRSRARGLELGLVTTQESVRRNPLLSSVIPQARVGPVFTQAILVDESLAVLAGPRTEAGAATAWTTTDRELVRLVGEVWTQTLALSRPVGSGEPRLNRRQVEVACLIACGETDRSVSRRLDISLRTVERDVRTILDLLGARSRTEAVLTMRGRVFPDGRSPS